MAIVSRGLIKPSLVRNALFLLVLGLVLTLCENKF